MSVDIKFNMSISFRDKPTLLSLDKEARSSIDTDATGYLSFPPQVNIKIIITFDKEYSEKQVQNSLDNKENKIREIIESTINDFSFLTHEVAENLTVLLTEKLSQFVNEKLINEVENDPKISAPSLKL